MYYLCARSGSVTHIQEVRLMWNASSHLDHSKDGHYTLPIKRHAKYYNYVYTDDQLYSRYLEIKTNLDNITFREYLQEILKHVL